MFIYKITVNNQVYIGLDTKEEYKKSRWKSHCKDSLSGSERKVHKAMAKFGIENCLYEVIDRGFTSICSLALAEIEHISNHDSYHNGLNSTLGGDGLGEHDLSSMSDEDFFMIKKTLGERFLQYNRKRWDNLSDDERKIHTSHLHNKTIYLARSETLKLFYENNPEIAATKSEGIRKWQEENRDQLVEQNKKNGLLGAQKVSKKVIVETTTGEVLIYVSRSEFQRQTKVWFSRLVVKSTNNEFYKGYRLKESNE
jgi:hypothetical protein